MAEAPLRFRVDYRKCIQGIAFLAMLRPGITQYYIGKTFFFADREHLLDWGRPISCDRYVAMEHGPVPSVIYDIIKGTSGSPDEVEDDLMSYAQIKPSGNKLQLYAVATEFPALSDSDKEYLASALKQYGQMSFGALRDLSHQDAAYREAWSNLGINNEMDMSLWLSGDGIERDHALAQLTERSEVVKMPIGEGRHDNSQMGNRAHLRESPPEPAR